MEPGSYTLVLTALGRSTAVVNSVPVVTNTVSFIKTDSTPLVLATSPTGTLTGTVTTNTSPIDAIVRALQTFTDGSKIEIISRPVNSSTGGYSYSLPTAAPQVASYVVLPNPLVFSSAGVAGKYTLEATSGGVVKTSVEQTVSANTTTTVPTFTFP